MHNKSVLARVIYFWLIGATVFPFLDVFVRPKAGDALFWYNTQRSSSQHVFTNFPILNPRMFSTKSKLLFERRCLCFRLSVCLSAKKIFSSKMDQIPKFGEQTSRILEFKPEGLEGYII